MSRNSFDARDVMDLGDRPVEVHRLDRAPEGTDTLPYSLRILMENLLRNEDGENITADDIRALAAWDPDAEPDTEILFTPARVLLQDFTGVPAVVDLAVMRDAVVELGGDAAAVDPLLRADLVIDHSIIAEHAGVPEAFVRNAEIEYERNAERYAFLRWGQGAFERLRVVPPNTGIVHQVNLEYLASVVMAEQSDDGGPLRAWPDTLVGTDSHTPMVNGLGVVGWGVGGIEAEAAMLGQPVSMLIPRVVGFQLEGELPEGTTATDLVLTVTEMLRAHGVVGSFVEFFGSGVSAVPLVNRATIGNMSPEYGSTIAVFPIDQRTLDYLAFTGRSEDHVALVEDYAQAQGLFHDPTARPARYSATLSLDLSTVVPSLAGPTRPQDRVRLDRAARDFRHAVRRFVPADHVVAQPEPASLDESLEETFPASDPITGTEENTPPRDHGAAVDRPTRPVTVTSAAGETFELDHGHVVIAAITSCTNTSNPSVMLAAGLLARNAVERGLTTRPWVKASLAPGSQVVMDYYRAAGLLPYLEKLRFNLVGFGCTTCIGNSGPLDPAISTAVSDHDLAVVSVLSGNRNFEGRINPDCAMNYLASPPLVVAYALAGSMDVDLLRDPLGDGHDGPVYLRDVWPTNAEISAVERESVQSGQFTQRYADVFSGDERWQGMDTPSGDRFAWDPDSTYVRKPTFFDGMPPTPGPLADVRGARCLAVLGDSVTTDHISPAGAIAPDSPAGRYLADHGVARHDFNSYGSRRGNHEVMVRGTFANIRLRNLLAPGTSGGVTRYLGPPGQPADEETTIYDAAMRYAGSDVPLVVLAGAEYGSGSSRDWAAKGTRMLGIRAVIARSYERIHRSNLIGMGVLPLELADGDTIESLGLTGREVIDITGIAGGETVPRTVTVTATPPESDAAGSDATGSDAAAITFTATVRIDTPNEQRYFRHGGILHSVLRQLAGRA